MKKENKKLHSFEENVWRVNTAGLLKEIASNYGRGVVGTPLQILALVLGEVAHRASELNDPKLNSLMARLALYEITDPHSKEYDAEKSNSLIKYGIILESNQPPLSQQGSMNKKI